VSLTSVAQHDGYWALAGLIGLEAAGIPIPGEAVLVAAGTYAGQTHKLNVWILWLVAVVAVMVGSTFSYWLGAKGGYKLLRKYGRYIHMNETEIKVGRYIFDRYGAVVVSAGRFVAVLRTYAPFLAGTNKMKWHKFLVFNAAGVIAWAGVWTWLSYELGNSLKHDSGKVDIAVGALAVVIIIGAAILVRRQAKKLEATAEAAYPGPLTD
jgi:membrane protein DedA with SNARE-associated domain